MSLASEKTLNAQRLRSDSSDSCKRSPFRTTWDKTKVQVTSLVACSEVCSASSGSNSKVREGALEHCEGDAPFGASGLTRSDRTLLGLLRGNRPGLV